MQRRQGYLEALDASDVAFDAALDIRVDFGFESAESATAKLLARGQDIDGIVATSDLIALGAIRALRKGGRMVPRSEEHTSELQSLMRISYAVLCLKKKKYKDTLDPQTTHSTDDI